MRLHDVRTLRSSREGIDLGTVGISHGDDVDHPQAANRMILDFPRQQYGTGAGPENRAT